MIYLWLVSILWAFSFSMIKGVLTGVDSFFVAFARLFISLLVLLPFMRVKSVSKTMRWRLFFIGMLQYGVMYIAYIHSFRYLQAYEVAVFTIFTPLFVTAWDDIARRKFHQKHALVALLAVIGTAIVVWQNIGRNDFWWGFFLVQISNVAFAVGQVQYKRLMLPFPSVKDKDVFALLFAGGVAITLLSSLVFTPWRELSLSTPQWLTLFYLGAIASGLCFFLWNMGARKVDVGSLAVFNNLKIPLATTVSLLFFGEQTDWRTLLLGGMIVVAALFWNEYPKTGKVPAAIED
jgi:carboxylate/amino acid/amine transporter